MQKRITTVAIIFIVASSLAASIVAQPRHDNSGKRRPADASVPKVSIDESWPPVIPTATPDPLAVPYPNAFNETGEIVAVESPERILVSYPVRHDKIEGAVYTAKPVQLVGITAFSPHPMSDEQREAAAQIRQQILLTLRDLLTGQAVRMLKIHSRPEPDDAPEIERYVWWRSTRLLNLDMLLYGYGKLAPDYQHTYRPQFQAAQQEARSQKIGIWAVAAERPIETPTPQEPASKTPDGRGGCNIKGLVAEDGFRYCIAPGDDGYAGVLLHPDRGERWFCSTEEAQEAGWNCY